MANDRCHFVSGVIHHHVSTHLCLGLSAGTDVRLELCFERHLLNPTIGSFLLEDAIQKSLGLDPIGSNGYLSATLSFGFHPVPSRTYQGVIRIKLPFRLKASGIALPTGHLTRQRLQATPTSAVILLQSLSTTTGHVTRVSSQQCS